MLADYIASVLSQRPASFWPGGEPAGQTVKDAVLHPLSDSTYDGTISGTVTPRHPTGLAVGGYGWDFTAGQIVVTDHAEYRQDYWTLEAWVNPDNHSDFQGVISKTNPVEPRPYDTYILPTTGLLRLIAGDGAGGFPDAVLESTAAVPVGKWTHILCTCGPRPGASGRRFRIFLNGKSSGLLDSATVPTGATSNLRIGNRNDGVTSMDGKIAFPAIYPRVIALGPVLERVRMGRGLLAGGRRIGGLVPA